MASSAIIFFRFGAVCECICHFRRGWWHCFDDGCCGREGKRPIGDLRGVIARTLRSMEERDAK